MWIIRTSSALRGGGSNTGDPWSWWERIVVRILLLQLSVFLFVDTVSASPLKVFAKGYNNKKLPPGGWTHWFNVDHPDGTGDFETYARIVRVYGRSCMGIPCRRPLAIKAVSTHGRTPRLNGDKVFVSPRHGLSCHGAHQQSFRCADYKVRFYCPNLHLKCSASRFYPQHHHHNQDNSSSPAQNNTTLTTLKGGVSLAKASRKKQRLLKKQLAGLWENDAKKKKRKKHKRRVKQWLPRWSTKEAMLTTRSTPIAADVSQSRKAVLTYHPRHPTFS